ncbi:MAG: zinc ribbon domain-containing protein [Planctomycetes bacterium]|nr:zinc ribbon domain-containing protein [Planctomycetota bacterium]
MPLFEFRCSDCEQDFEILVRSHERPACPDCGQKTLEKLFSETATPVISAGGQGLPITSACPPGNAPCRPNCCRM